MALSTRCTVILAFVVATALVVVARAGASIPFVPDDSGYLISDSAKSKCEQKVAGNVAKLAKGLLKCHSKMADASFTTMTPVDDESCESTAISAFLAKTDVTACPCVDPSNIASLWEGSLDTQNSALY